MPVKFKRSIGKVSAKPIYEIFDGEKSIGFITKIKTGWNVDFERINRTQTIRDFQYFKVAKEYIKDVRAV